jgi:hypothetical protein
MVQLLQGLHLEGLNDKRCFHIRENQKNQFLLKVFPNCKDVEWIRI